MTDEVKKETFPSVNPWDVLVWKLDSIERQIQKLDQRIDGLENKFEQRISSLEQRTSQSYVVLQWTAIIGFMAEICKNLKNTIKSRPGGVLSKECSSKIVQKNPCKIRGSTRVRLQYVCKWLAKCLQDVCRFTGRRREAAFFVALGQCPTGRGKRAGAGRATGPQRAGRRGDGVFLAAGRSPPANKCLNELLISFLRWFFKPGVLYIYPDTPTQVFAFPGAI